MKCERKKITYQVLNTLHSYLTDQRLVTLEVIEVVSVRDVAQEVTLRGSDGGGWQLAGQSWARRSASILNTVSQLVKNLIIFTFYYA